MTEDCLFLFHLFLFGVYLRLVLGQELGLVLDAFAVRS